MYFLQTQEPEKVFCTNFYGMSSVESILIDVWSGSSINWHVENSLITYYVIYILYNKINIANKETNVFFYTHIILVCDVYALKNKIMKTSSFTKKIKNKNSKIRSK